MEDTGDSYLPCSPVPPENSVYANSFALTQIPLYHRIHAFDELGSRPLGSMITILVRNDCSESRQVEQPEVGAIDQGDHSIPHPILKTDFFVPVSQSHLATITTYFCLDGVFRRDIR